MKTIRIATSLVPPKWALMQRALIDILNHAAVEFVERYTRADGTLIWRNDWPGMDGSDDPYEGFMYLELLYALGGSDEVHALAQKMWDTITWQWTQYGQIYNEFDAYYDWMHHGEGYLYFYFMGLSNPSSVKNVQRAIRFANFYTGQDQQVPNYDPNLRLIRSPITGSRGPRFQMTEEDWITHRGILDDYLAPFEDIPGVDFESRKCPWSNDDVYKAIITKMNERMARGDVPLNLNATSLVANAFMYTNDELYRTWVLEYLQAWEQRAEQNGGIVPDNIGLSGKIGEYNDGKWWGGYYGWRWPHGLMTIMEPIVNATMNAALLSKNVSRLDFARQQLDLNWSLGYKRNGQWVVPHRHFDKGWADYDLPNPVLPIHLWMMSMANEDEDRILRIDMPESWKAIDIPTVSGGNPITKKNTKHYNGNTIPWFLYMRGEFPSYPEEILHANYQLIAGQLEKMRSRYGDPSQWDLDAFNQETLSSIHIWQEVCPVYFEALVQLIWGAPMHLSHGGLQHARVRYFDSARNKPGLPVSVAALVESIHNDTTTLQLVNTNLFEQRELVIQAGGFGEHQFKHVAVIDEHGEILAAHELDDKWLQVSLAPGAGAKMVLTMQRYVNNPSYQTPWSDLSSHPIQPRTQV